MPDKCGPTPEPWQITEWPGCEVDHGRIVIECAESVRQEGRVIAFIRGSPNMPPGEVMPNAHLLVAAPKLLAALEAAEGELALLFQEVGAEVLTVKQWADFNNVWDKASAAIKRAKGEG